MCEKSLLPDAFLCANSTNIGSSILVNSSTTLTIRARFTAAMCMQYCRGLYQGYPYAVVDERSCTCGTNITFDPNIPTSRSNVTLPFESCQRSDSLSLIGKTSNTGKDPLAWKNVNLEWINNNFNFLAVAIYNTNLSAIHSNPKLGSSTCKSYDAELYITRFGIDSLLLQSDYGKPTLRASCSYLHKRLV